MGYKWIWISAAAILVLMAAWGGRFLLGSMRAQDAADSLKSTRPATIENVLLRIESNISRIQTTMEDLVFSEYASNLADDVESVNQLAATVNQDFQEMGALLPADNAQYRRALAQLREWKAIRVEIIELTSAGPSPLAKEIVRSKSAAQVQKLMASLKELESFSQKRTDDFDAQSLNTHKD